MKRAVFGAMVLVFSVGANAQAQDSGTPPSNPSPLECAAPFQSQIILGQMGVGENNEITFESTVETFANWSSERLYALAQLLDIEVERRRSREPDEVFTRLDLTTELLQATLDFERSDLSTGEVGDFIDACAAEFPQIAQDHHDEHYHD